MEQLEPSEPWRLHILRKCGFIRGSQGSCLGGLLVRLPERDGAFVRASLQAAERSSISITPQPLLLNR